MDSINKIREYIDKNLSEKRKKHTYGVRDTAVRLAKKYGGDAEKAETAALAHDLYRGAPDSVLNYYVTHLGLESRYTDDPNLSHSKIAAAMIEKSFGISDRDIINAVSFHTTGRDGMSLLEKIVYISDAIEPGRTYAGVEDIRSLAEKDLDEACLLSLSRTIDYVRSEGKFLDEDTVKAKEYFENIIKNKKEREDDQ